jgi:homoserine dehydrogenase
VTDPRFSAQVPLHVGFVGTGLIGGVAVKQVASRAGTLLEQTGLDLKLAGATDSKARSYLHWSPYDRVGVVNADP